MYEIQQTSDLINLVHQPWWLIAWNNQRPLEWKEEIIGFQAKKVHMYELKQYPMMWYTKFDPYIFRFGFKGVHVYISN